MEQDHEVLIFQVALELAEPGLVEVFTKNGEHFVNGGFGQFLAGLRLAGEHGFRDGSKR
jgi:hypothetical protein